MKILLAGEQAAGVQALKAVQKSGHEVVAVLTNPAEAIAQATRGATVASVARMLKYPIIPARRVKDPLFAQEVKRMGVDVLLNVHSFHIVNAQVIGAVALGAFNLHPGPLPDYAGMNVPSWAILNGEREHGVTLHWMTAGIDEGEIAYQERFALCAADTGLSVTIRCVDLGLKMIETLLKALHHDPAKIPRLRQDLSKRRYFGVQRPFDGKVQWNMSADELERFVRASDHFPFPSPIGYPTVDVHGRAVGLMKVSRTQAAADAVPGSIRQRDGVVWLATKNEWLAVHRVLVDGRVVEEVRNVLYDGQQL